MKEWQNHEKHCFSWFLLIFGDFVQNPYLILEGNDENDENEHHWTPLDTTVGQNVKVDQNPYPILEEKSKIDENATFPCRKVSFPEYQVCR